MKNLNELKERKVEIEKELAQKQKELVDMNIKVKTATDEDLTALASQADALSMAIQDLITQADNTGKEIDNAEKQLDEFAKGAKKKMVENKNKEVTNGADYLKTKEAAIDYAKMLVDNQGVSSKSLSEKWLDHLKTKGISDGLDIVLPQPVISAISDAFVDYQGVINHVSKDPRYYVKAAFQSTQAIAQGHKKGQTKKNAEVSFESIAIQSDTIYIKFDFHYADLKKDTDGTYFNYVMQELAKAHIRAVERAIVIGDGLPAGHDDKITEIKSIEEEADTRLFDTAGGDFDAAAYTQDQLEAITAGLDKLVPTGTPVLVTTKTIARKLKLTKDAMGLYIDPQPFAPISTAGNDICGYKVYVYDWMELADNPILAFVDRCYKTIGAPINADRFDSYDITVNKRDIELATVMGGRLTDYKCAVKFEQTP